MPVRPRAGAALAILISSCGGSRGEPEAQRPCATDSLRVTSQVKVTGPGAATVGSGNLNRSHSKARLPSRSRPSKSVRTARPPRPRRWRAQPGPGAAAGLAAALCGGHVRVPAAESRVRPPARRRLSCPEPGPPSQCPGCSGPGPAVTPHHSLNPTLARSSSHESLVVTRRRARDGENGQTGLKNHFEFECTRTISN